MSFFEELKNEFILNFLDGAKWKWLVDGLTNTLIITFFALLLGVAIGVIIAIIRSTYDKNREVYKKNGGAGYVVLSILNFISGALLKSPLAFVIVPA